MDNYFSPEFDNQEDDALYRAVDEFERWAVEKEPADNIIIEAVVHFERFNATPPVDRGKFDLSEKNYRPVCLSSYLLTTTIRLHVRPPFDCSWTIIRRLRSYVTAAYDVTEIRLFTHSFFTIQLSNER